MSASPQLSVIVGFSSDTIAPVARADYLAECLEALAKQADPPTMEIIVAHHEPIEGLDAVKARFSDVRFLSTPDVVKRVGGREHHDVPRGRAIAAATGELIGLLEDHELPDPRWAASVVEAHRRTDAGIGGAIENGVDRALNWAVYFCDFGRYQNPVPAGASAFASDANVTYKRADLDLVRESWEDAYREVPVNDALRALGKTISLDPTMVVYQNRHALTFGEALRERYSWGRSYGATRVTWLTTPKRLAYTALAPVLPALLLLRMGRRAWQRKRHFGNFLRAVPFIVPLLMAWSSGEMAGYLAPQRVNA
ncbi:glycosyltransferase [Sphingomonas daechungensis]|uniref:glycosyltransferase n=1 Tax=Sphingomonas daechungensis TaxID=1176646 RepID=UPI00378466E1